MTTMTHPDTAQTTSMSSSTGSVAIDTSDEFRLPVLDLYRDIHKGIRAELFAITSEAGSFDPSASCDWVALADHVGSVERLLSDHAGHEDTFVDPVLRELEPNLAEQIETDHHRLDALFARLSELSTIGGSASLDDRRRIAQLLYLDLSDFTSEYLRHQYVEERVVMPVLESHVGFDEILGIHQAIIGSIPPDQMAASLAFMLPAMNVDDRTELLGGMKAGAPPEAFAGVVGLARSVLVPAEFSKVATRLGL